MAKDPIQISRNKDRHITLDAERLRAKGMKLIQELSGHVWTDYNLHDPGVTILEQLCYAITDLAYKTDFPIEEILADERGLINPSAHSFFNKAEILSSGPVTTKDYCKLVLDQVVEVENLWIEAVAPEYASGASKGIYRVWVQPCDDYTGTSEELVADVRNCLLRNRNLGENFEEITVLQPQHISVKTEILVDAKENIKETVAYICNAIEHVIHPPVRFLSEAELLASGYSTEDIYSGPLLGRGFIPDSDLHERQTEIDPADMIKAISMVEGVLQIKYLYVDNSSKPLKILPGHYPYINIEDTKNDIGIYSDQFEHYTKDSVFWNTYQRIREIKKRHYTGQQRGLADNTLKAPFRNISRYYSMQRYFPGIYGLGEEGIAGDEPPLRKAQVKQLKAYLLFFEQLMTNYLAQLGNMESFFSADTKATYFAQGLSDVPHVAPLLGDEYMHKLLEAVESDATYQDRKKKILNHLLARFNIRLGRYPVTLYDKLYSTESSVISWKADILKHLPASLAAREQSFNYLDDFQQTGIISGYQQWIGKLLHINNNSGKPLTSVFAQEHVAMKVVSHKPAAVVKEIHMNGETVQVTDNVPEDQQYFFGHQPVSILRYGVDPGNYKIVEDSHHLVLYKAPDQQTWQAVARHAQRSGAMDAQRDMIRHLQQLSISSEGFYVVEHNLLKPLFKTAAFGFSIKGAGNSLLLEQRYFMTFEERENIVATLMTTNWQGMSYEEMFNQMANWCRIYNYDGASVTFIDFSSPEHKEAAEQAMYKLTLNIAQLQLNKPLYYPRMEYTIKMDNGKLLPESFFRSTVTIVFPSWPARFQYAEFRSFAEELIRENTPAHYNIYFRWLGVADMHAFEDYYYPWLQGLKPFFTSGITNTAANRLIDFLS
jgi:hypothetical protein